MAGFSSNAGRSGVKAAWQSGKYTDQQYLDYLQSMLNMGQIGQDYYDSLVYDMAKEKAAATYAYDTGQIAEERRAGQEANTASREKGEPETAEYIKGNDYTTLIDYLMREYSLPMSSYEGLVNDYTTLGENPQEATDWQERYGKYTKQIEEAGVSSWQQLMNQWEAAANPTTGQYNSSDIQPRARSATTNYGQGPLQRTQAYDYSQGPMQGNKYPWLSYFANQNIGW